MPVKVLVVDDDPTNVLILRALLERDGYVVVSADGGVAAVEAFGREAPALVLMDVMMPGMDGYEATRRIKALDAGGFVPVIFLTAIQDQDEIERCVAAGGDDFLTKPYNHVVLQSKMRALLRIRELHRTVTEQNVELNRFRAETTRQNEMAARIVESILRGGVTAHPSVRSHLSASTEFNGDFMLAAFRAPGELHVLVGDFTGHGLSAAVGALPVSEVFYTMTSNGFAIGEIAQTINGKLRQVLPANMFLAASLFSVDAVEKKLSVWHGGLPDLLIVDPANRIRRAVKSTHMPLGILGDAAFDRALHVEELAMGERIYVCTDGLIDAPIATGGRFGQGAYEACFGAPVAPERQFDWVIDSVRELAGAGPQDDMTLVEVTVNDALVHGSRDDRAAQQLLSPARWDMAFDFDITALRGFDPVPYVLRGVMEIQGLARHKEALFTIVSELFSNALDHGVLRLDSKLKHGPAGFTAYFAEREARLRAADAGYVRLRVSNAPHGGGGRLTLRVEDSGPGFDYARLEVASEAHTELHGRGVPLLRGLCSRLEYLGAGNIVEAEFDWKF